MINDAGHRYMASEANCKKAYLTLWVNHNTSIQMYSSFKENCQEIVNYSLPTRKKQLKKFNTNRKMSPDELPLL